MINNFPLNHYELAFENWLKDNHIPFAAADEHKRSEIDDSQVKGFDFLLKPPGCKPIIAEVKGRKFKGTSFENLTGFECWVTKDDVNGLSKWKQYFGDCNAVFLFAYMIENIDVDFDGREVYYFDSNRYVFFAIMLEDYQKYMKRRSPKWKTVTLAADHFRECSIEAVKLLG